MIALVLSQERRTDDPVGQEELFRVIQLLMDKARAYTVTTPNAEFHSKASMFISGPKSSRNGKCFLLLVRINTCSIKDF